MAKYFQLNNLLRPIYLSFIRKKKKLLVLLNIMKGREENIPVKKKCYDVIEISKTDITIRSLITWWKLSD